LVRVAEVLRLGCDVQCAACSARAYTVCQFLCAPTARRRRKLKPDSGDFKQTNKQNSPAQGSAAPTPYTPRHVPPGAPTGTARPPGDTSVSPRYPCAGSRR
jgi:hypothetical protein